MRVILISAMLVAVACGCSRQQGPSLEERYENYLHQITKKTEGVPELVQQLQGNVNDLQQRLGKLEFTPEKELPDKFDGKTHPRIIISGERLEWSEADKWYHFAGTDVRAMWMAIGKRRELATTDRRNDDGTVDVFKSNGWGGRWVRSESRWEKGPDGSPRYIRPKQLKKEGTP